MTQNEQEVSVTPSGADENEYQINHDKKYCMGDYKRKDHLGPSPSNYNNDGIYKNAHRLVKNEYIKCIVCGEWTNRIHKVSTGYGCNGCFAAQYDYKLATPVNRNLIAESLPFYKANNNF